MVAMLGDLKGVKSLIEENKTVTLVKRITIINEILAKAFLKEKNRSRSLCCYSFSDSILAIWKSNKEGLDYSKEFSLNIWKQINAKGFPYRIFIDGGLEFTDADSIGDIISREEKRFMKLFPISISIWSIFLAENSKFPEGIFMGANLIKQTHGTEIYNAGKFSYIKIA